jgi:hypothetical protein
VSPTSTMVLVPSAFFMVIVGMVAPRRLVGVA